MKKVLSLLLVIALTAAIAIGGTLAYLTDRDNETNVFTMGNVDIELSEVFEQSIQLMPGKTVQKEVTVTNTGDNDAWVFYTYAVPTGVADQNENPSMNVIHMNPAARNWDTYRENTKYWVEGQTEAVSEEDTWHYITVDGKGKLDVIEVDGLTYDVYGFWYNGVLTPGETTTVGLEKVYLDTRVDYNANDGKYYWVEDGTVREIPFDLSSVMIFVNAYAIQADATIDTAEKAFDAYNAQWAGLNGTYEPVDPNAPPVVEVSADDLANVEWVDGATYRLSGKFSGDVKMPDIKAGFSVTIDATGATFEDKGTVTINAPGVAHAYSSFDAHRAGTVTVKGFSVQTLNVLAYNNKTVNIIENKISAMSVIGGNFALNISGNTVDGNFGKYIDGEGQELDYGISLRITDYELSITNNTITDTYSHSIGINGRQGEVASDWGNCGANNKITQFSGNNITVNTTQKTGRSALKIWCDQVYAPYATSGHEPTAAAKSLMEAILADSTNVFTLGEGHTIFNIFDYKTNTAN